MLNATSGNATDPAGTSKGVQHSWLQMSNSSASNFGSFIGRYLESKNLFVGLYLGNASSGQTADAIGMFVMVGSTAEAGLPTAPGICSNTTASVTTLTQLNNTGNSGGITSINDIGWTAAKTKFSISDSYDMVTSDWVAFNATVTGYGSSGGAVHVFSYSIDGASAESVSNLRLLKINNSSSAGASLSRDQVKEFTYSTTAKNIPTDGKWWISTAAGGSAVAADAPLSPLETYYVNVAIKDNGGYDAHPSIGYIIDPSLLTKTTPTASSSSSSSGCVFNPAAGFGLEWLLLLLAPAIGIIRSRFKK
jgi:hypothetical protein